jgi:transcriptional regulator with XRE-family HTH domain
MESLAKRVKARRRELKLNQSQVAELAGLKQPDISKIELGLIQKTTEILGLARALQCNPDWLATGEGEETKNPGGTKVTEFADRRTAYRQVTVDIAIQAIADHLADFPDKAKAISLLTTLVHSPHLASVVAAELKDLRPEARDAPSNQTTPEKKASNAGSR